MGRADVVGRIARWCDSAGFAQWEHDDVGREYLAVATWSDSEWLTAAKAAKVRTAMRDNKVPSERTRGQVIGIVTGMANRDKREGPDRG